LLNATNQFVGGNPYAMMGDQMREMQDPAYLANMMNDPAFRGQMETMMSDPNFVDQMIAMNPQMAPMRDSLRQTMQSPFFRSLLTNPEVMRSIADMRASGANSPFGMGGPQTGGMPAPGSFGFGSGSNPNATNTNTTTNPSNPNQTPNQNPFGMLGGPFGMGMMGNPMLWGGGMGNNQGQQTTPSTTSTTESNPTDPSNPSTPNPNPNPTAIPQPNPFGFPFGGGNANPQQLNEAMANLGRMFGGGGGGGMFNPMMGMGGMGGMGGFGAPQDSRSPEERYETQLGQLRELGFTDARMNVRALIATGGVVEAAVEYILTGGAGDNNNNTGNGNTGGGGGWQNMFG